MATRPANNLVSFTPVDAPGVQLFLAPEGTIVWEPGLKPNVWSFRCSFFELKKLKGNVGRIGSLKLYDTVEPPADADVAIQNCRIVDCQPIAIGEAAGTGSQEPDTWQNGKGLFYTEYRLSICDWRDRFVAPRGGRLKLGVVNPKPEQITTGQGGGDKAAKKQKEAEYFLTYRQMLETCLEAMGFAGTPLPGDLDRITPPQDVRWLGNHAPTELDKLLKRGRYLFVPLTNGRAKIEKIGLGALPSFRGGDALPELTAPAVDRRGKTLIITSYPSRVLCTREIPGPTIDDSWSFVLLDKDGIYKWVGASVLAPGGLDRHVRNGFTSIDPAYRASIADDAYRVIRVPSPDSDAAEGDEVPPWVSAPLAYVADSSGRRTDLVFRAKIAVRNATTGLWENKADVPVPVESIQGDLIYLSRIVGQVEKDGVTDFYANFKEIPDRSAKVTISYEGSEKGKDGKWVPTYYEVGYTRDAGKLRKLSEDEVKNALAGAGDDCWIVTDPTLQLRIWNTEEQNRPALEKAAAEIAEDFLQESGTTVRHRMARGYQAVELSGLATKITWDPSRFLTDVEVANWWAADGAIDASAYQELADQAYPNQDKVESDRQTQGATGDRQRVFPQQPGQTLLDIPAGAIPVLATVDGGVAGSNTTACTWTYKLATIAGTDIAEAVKLTPDVARFDRCEYLKPADKSPAFAYRDSAGKWKLYHVAGEIPKTDRVTVVVDLQDNGTDLQRKTQELLVLESGDASDWVTFAEGTVCP